MKFSIKPIKMLLALGAAASFVHAGDYSTWARYRPVTLSTVGMGMTAAVTNVPLSIRFKASAHKDMLDSAATQVQANGSDIRVTLDDGTTDVPFEIEHLSTGPNGRLHLWVLAANVPANNAAAATFRVFWGRTGQTSMSAPSAVFPASAGYQAVFHLNDTGSTIFNSANSALNGTATGTSTTVGQSAGNGFVSAKSGARVRTFGTSGGGEANENPADNYITFSPGASHILSTHTGPFTMEAWVYSSITNNGNTSQGTKHIVAHGDGNTGGKAWFARTAGLDGSTGQNHYSAGGVNSIAGPIAPFGEQHHWQFVTAVFDGTNYIIYRQRENDPWNNATVAGPTGMLPDSAHYKILPGTAPTASTLPWFIGGASDNTGANVTRGWHGWMDEVRISTVARDSNYVKLTFLTSRADTLGGVVHPILIGESESPNLASPYAAWSGHRSIVLNTSATGANVAGTVTNFPVLVRLGTAEAAIINAANGGNSIRFSKANDVTPLPYEIESWSPTAAAIWVKVDTILGNNATQTIRMHWGNAAAASESNGAAVFDTANNFVAVWHMNGTTTETSSTAHGFVATGPVDSVPTVAANSAIGGARQFSGTQYMRAIGTAASAMSFAAESSYTISSWVRSDSIVPAGNNTGHAIITKGDHQWALAIFGATAPNRYYEITTKITGWRQTTTAPTTTPVAYGGDTANSKIGVWRHITGTWTGLPAATATGQIYMDGVLQKTTEFNTTTGSGARQTARDVHIGVLSNQGTGSTAATGMLQRFFVGAIDEITVSRGIRDSNWIRLTYQNQKASNSLVNIGLPVFSVPGQPTSVTATADTLRARIAWLAPSDNGGSPITGYKATVVGDTTLACETTTLTCTISGLSAGVSYNMVVRAINMVGGGANSNASNAVTPVSPVVPGAPTGATTSNITGTSVTVTWVAPTVTGGAPISGYTVTATPGGLTCFTTGELTCAVTGLTQGTAYTFTVTATNAAGNSPASASTSATTGIQIPGAFVISMDGSRNPYTYRLPTSAVSSTEKLTMTINDVQGKRVWTRTINPAATKTAELTWNGVTSTGRAVAPGLYVVKISATMNGKTIETINKSVKQ